jgi:hypothetical protein
MAKDLERILNIDPKDPVTSSRKILDTIQRNYAEVFDFTPDERFNEDFEDVREGLKNLITEMSDIIQKLSLIAQDSEKAAHFTALAK